MPFLVGHDKRYTAEVVLGVETSTLDAAGEVVARHDMGPVDLDEVRRVVAANLLGPIEQVPPMVSALRVGGRRLHELAREGIEVERAARPVTIWNFEVAPGAEPDTLAIDVTCSAGTYVRTLAADLGRLLGGGAHLRHLRRVSSGGFSIDEAAAADTAELLAPLAALRGMDVVDVDDDTAAMVRHGRVLARWPGEGPWAVTDRVGELLAVYEAFGAEQAKPAMVVPTE
jgi:tRNA pseudouridine55 synthase